KVLQTFNGESFFVGYRISVRSQNYTYCCVVFKLQIDLVQCPVDAGLADFYHIIFHSGDDYLSLRIAESGIIFQDLWPLFRKHQTEEDNPLKLSSFCRHGVYCRLINILLAEFINFFGIEGAWRE